MERIWLVRVLVVVALGWGLAATRRVWRGPRNCPRLPLIPGRFPTGLAEEQSFYGGLVVLLAGSLVSDGCALLFAALFGVLCLADWTRMRPMFYQNVCLLLAIILYPGQEGLNIARLLTVSVYFWAGLLKINRVFFTLVYPWLAYPLGQRLPPGARVGLQALGWLVPWLEAAMGLGLLFPATRTAALMAVVAMHLLILVLFSPLGHNTHVCIRPWNTMMLLTDVALFWATPAVDAQAILVGQGSPAHLAALALFALMPGLGLGNRLDPVFSHGHMSGRHLTGTLTLTIGQRSRLPAELREHCVLQSGITPKHFYSLDISNWYLRELGVPPPQQERLLRAVAREFARFGARQGELNLVVRRMPAFWSAGFPQVSYSWSELESF